MIKPTVGRIVWYHPSDDDKKRHHPMIVHGTELAAMITHVWGDTTVNLVVFDSNGRGHERTRVPLVQEGMEPYVGIAFCEWMPYQKGAGKTEQLAAQLQAAAAAE